MREAWRAEREVWRPVRETWSHEPGTRRRGCKAQRAVPKAWLPEGSGAEEKRRGTFRKRRYLRRKGPARDGRQKRVAPRTSAERRSSPAESPCATWTRPPRRMSPAPAPAVQLARACLPRRVTCVAARSSATSRTSTISGTRISRPSDGWETSPRATSWSGSRRARNEGSRPFCSG